MKQIEQRINQSKKAKTDEEKKTLLESVLLMLKGKTVIIEKELFAAKERIIKATKHPLVADREISNLKRPFKEIKTKTIEPKKKTSSEKAIEAELRTKELLLKSGVPDIFLEARLSDFPAKYKTFVSNSFFIHGTVGCGKTHLLAAIVREYIQRTKKDKHLLNISMFRKIGNVHTRVQPIFISISDLLFRLRGVYSNSNENEQDIINKIINCPILCLDDFGTDKVTDWNVQILYQIINSRYNNKNKLGTYIASNLGLKDIAERFDERIASRVEGMCKNIKLTGKDRRLSENSKSRM